MLTLPSSHALWDAPPGGWGRSGPSRSWWGWALDLPYDVRVSNLVYLLIAIALSAVGLLVLWIRTRPPTTSPRSSVEEFHHKMRALAPDEPADRHSGRGA